MSVRARGPAVARAAAGPALIVLAVLLVLHDFAFGGMAPSQQNDVLGFWLPNHCLLGRSLAAGDIPAWNPHVLAGVPMAADPQSGWMYLPTMALYSALPCAAALPAFLVLQPVLAGLAMYAFLRSEELSRVAATVGGLAMAMAIAGSRVAVSLPVAGALAWSAVLLALASRALRAPTWSSRLGWVALAAVAWGQLAAAHLSHGLALGTAAVLLYGTARATADVRAGRRSGAQAVVLGVVFVAALVPVNLAYLLPRLGYVATSTLGLGYDGLRELTIRLSDHAPPAVLPRAPGGFAWPLTFATSPGAYLGAVPLVISLVALWSRRHRPLAGAMAAFGGGCYLLSLPGVARALAPVARAIPYGDVYLHAPSRLRYGLLLVIPVLSAIGIDAWRAAPAGRRWWMLAPGAAVWLVLPVVVGVSPRYLALAWGAGAVGAVALAASARRAAMAAVVPAVLAVELSLGALVGQAVGGQVSTAPSPSEVAWVTPFENLEEPDVEPARYLAEGPIARSLRTGGGGRYLTLQPDREARSKGYVGPWTPGQEGLMDNQRAMLFGLEDAQGYNPVQPLRFWSFSRRTTPAPPKYNVTVFPDPDEVVLDLLQVEWVVGPPSVSVEGFHPAVREGPWVLQRGPARPRASLFGAWTAVPDGDAALALVASDTFDPSSDLVLQEDPGVSPGGAAGGTAAYRALGAEDAEVVVDAPAPAVLLVRTSFDRHWRATVDGRSTPVLVADSTLQAVAVPAGRHVVRLRYRDPTIVAGLAGSGGALLVLVAAALAAARVERRRRRTLAPIGDEAGRPPPS
ncbi:MAG: hypothetical protein ACRDI0_09475 [Actinomycetota bacterium]